MPSYYDSSKKKPGKAKVVYNRGGSTSTREGKARLKDAARKPQQRRRTDPERRDAVIAATPTFRVPGRPTGSRKASAKRTPQERWEQSRNPITVALRKLDEAIDASDATRNRMGQIREVQNKSKGGQLKVTGMGAATRGGNFTRNG